MLPPKPPAATQGGMLPPKPPGDPRIYAVSA